MDVISYNGIPSSVLGVIVDGYYTKSVPQRKTNSYTIPGRNGTFLEDTGVYENCTQEYTLYWLPEQTKDTQVLDWLRQDGYYKFQHSDDPEHYYLAQASLPAEVTNHRDCYHEISAKFNCKPQMFLVAGDKEEVFMAAGVLRNPTLYDAKPLIKVYGTTEDPSTVTIQGVTLTLSAVDGYVILDCELQEAYKGNVNKNNTVSGEFPVLSGGKTCSVSFTGAISKVEIIPRWWTL